jgi:hypothetical protein
VHAQCLLVAVSRERAIKSNAASAIIGIRHGARPLPCLQAARSFAGRYCSCCRVCLHRSRQRRYRRSTRGNVIKSPSRCGSARACQNSASQRTSRQIHGRAKVSRLRPGQPVSEHEVLHARVRYQPLHSAPSGIVSVRLGPPLTLPTAKFAPLECAHAFKNDSHLGRKFMF